MQYPQHLLKVIEMLKMLPGVGSKSAERFAFQMLAWRPEQLTAMAQAIETIPEKLKQCDDCGCLKNVERCLFCEESRSHAGTLCIIASPRDAFAIESTREYKGLYHVLGALLSPLDRRGPEQLNLPKLM